MSSRCVQLPYNCLLSPRVTGVRAQHICRVATWGMHRWPESWWNASYRETNVISSKRGNTWKLQRSIGTLLWEKSLWTIHYLFKRFWMKGISSLSGYKLVYKLSWWNLNVSTVVNFWDKMTLVIDTTVASLTDCRQFGSLLFLSFPPWEVWRNK